MTNRGGATIADGARFDGTYKGGDLRVLGHFEGLLELSGRLQLAPQGCVKGIVEAAAVEIEGEFEGELRAGVLAFGATARADGVFHAPRLSMCDGARVDGALNVEAAARGATAGAEPQTATPRDAPARPADEAAADDDAADDDAPAASPGEGAAMGA